MVILLDSNMTTHMFSMNDHSRVPVLLPCQYIEEFSCGFVTVIVAVVAVVVIGVIIGVPVIIHADYLSLG